MKLNVKEIRDIDPGEKILMGPGRAAFHPGFFRHGRPLYRLPGPLLLFGHGRNPGAPQGGFSDRKQPHDPVSEPAPQAWKRLLSMWSSLEMRCWSASTGISGQDVRMVERMEENSFVWTASGAGRSIQNWRERPFRAGNRKCSAVVHAENLYGRAPAPSKILPGLRIRPALSSWWTW